MRVVYILRGVHKSTTSPPMVVRIRASVEHQFATVGSL